MGFPGGSVGKEFACNAGDAVWSLGQEDPLGEGMAIHLSIPTWRIPYTKEPGKLKSTGSQRVGHDYSDWRMPAHVNNTNLLKLINSIMYTESGKGAHLNFVCLFTKFLPNVKLCQSEDKPWLIGDPIILFKGLICSFRIVREKKEENFPF